MSFLSLPDECLAEILSYSDYSTLSNCRLTCRRINKVVKNYKLQKLNVKGINLHWFERIQMLHIDIIHAKIDYEVEVFQKKKNRTFRNKATGYGSIISFLDRYFTKIESTTSIFLLKLEITDQFLPLFIKHRKIFRNCNNWRFHGCSFLLSLSQMKEFLSAVQSQNLSILDCQFANEDGICDEMLFGIPAIVNFSIRPEEFPRLSITDKYLASFGDRIFDVSFQFEGHITGFQFSTIRKLVKERLDRRKYSGLWNFGVLAVGNWNLREYNEFVEYYRNSQYDCRYWLNPSTEEFLIYIPTRLTGLERVAGYTIRILCQL